MEALVEAVVDHQEEVQAEAVVEVAEDHRVEVQVERQCVQAERQYVEVDKCGHVVHHVVYWMEMQDV